MCACLHACRVKNDQLYTRYCRVQMWKRLYNKLHFGVADRPLNFNKVCVSCVCVFAGGRGA